VRGLNRNLHRVFVTFIIYSRSLNVNCEKKKKASQKVYECDVYICKVAMGNFLKLFMYDISK